MGIWPISFYPITVNYWTMRESQYVREEGQALCFPYVIVPGQMAFSYNEKLFVRAFYFALKKGDLG